MARGLVRIPSTRIGLFRVKRHDVEFPGPGFLILHTVIGDLHAIARIRARALRNWETEKFLSLFVRRPPGQLFTIHKHTRTFFIM
jgi:hypothetical protein